MARSKKCTPFSEIPEEYRERLRERIESRMESNLVVVELGECWEYAHRPSSNGYGRVSVYAHEHVAHRVYWQLLTGEELPALIELDHACYNRKCVNPAHLSPVTRIENCATRRSHGPYPNTELVDVRLPDVPF